MINFVFGLNTGDSSESAWAGTQALNLEFQIEFLGVYSRKFFLALALFVQAVLVSGARASQYAAVPLQTKAQLAGGKAATTSG